MLGQEDLTALHYAAFAGSEEAANALDATDALTIQD